MRKRRREIFEKRLFRKPKIKLNWLPKKRKNC